jgi:hypothetical protein
LASALYMGNFVEKDKVEVMGDLRKKKLVDDLERG